MFDTMTTFYDILNSATMAPIRKKREKQNKEVFGFDWGERNRSFRGVVEGLRIKTKLNLVLLEHAGPVYRGGEPTGRFESGAPKKVSQWVDMSGKLVYEPEKGLDPKDSDNWILWVDKSRANVALMGKGIYNPTHERLLAAIDG